MPKFGGNHLLVGGSFDGEGTFQLESGTTTVNSACMVLSPYLQTGGSLAGSGVVHLGGDANWIRGGPMSGTGTTILDAELPLSGTESKSVSAGRVVNTNADTHWTGGDNSLNSSTWNNNGTFHVSVANTITGDRTSAFNNTGTPIRDVTSGTATIEAPFCNSGLVEVRSGTLHIDNYTQTAGSLILAGGTFSSSNTINLLGGNIEAAGLIAGSVLVDGGWILPGFSAGNISISGNLTLGSSSQLFIEPGGLNQGTQYDWIAVAGNLILGGELRQIPRPTPPASDPSFD